MAGRWELTDEQWAVVERVLRPARHASCNAINHETSPVAPLV